MCDFNKYVMICLWGIVSHCVILIRMYSLFMRCGESLYDFIMFRFFPVVFICFNCFEKLLPLFQSVLIIILIWTIFVIHCKQNWVCIWYNTHFSDSWKTIDNILKMHWKLTQRLLLNNLKVKICTSEKERW